MGVSFNQHRITIGVFNVSKAMKSKYTINNCDTSKWPIKAILTGFLLTLYVYAICILLAGAVTTACDGPNRAELNNLMLGVSLYEKLGSYLNLSLILCLSLLYNRYRMRAMLQAKTKPSRTTRVHPKESLLGLVGKAITISVSAFNVGTIICTNPFYLCLFVLKVSANVSTHAWGGVLKANIRCKASVLFWKWISALNLILLVICNPGMQNPGPSKHFAVLYQNVRGFVPFSGLGEKIMPLDSDKILDFQCHVYQTKPDIIILNETWLAKEHNDAELFPNNTHKVFRLDRSSRTHPPDPSNPKKFRKKGGGVLLAVKESIDVETKEVSVGSKAEILSILIKSKHQQLCLTTCYRVGTLGDNNLLEVEKHLRSVASKKKCKAQIIIGDFNLSSVSWNDNISNIGLENKFVDLFNDLGLTQIIDKPTHEKGKVLDLLLTNVPGLVNNWNVLSKNAVCSSDHYAITFDLRTKYSSKSSKRKLYNYKKEKLVELDKEFKSVKWDQHLTFCDPETAWSHFKKIVFFHVDKNIPTVTIKNPDQPYWYDSDLHDLCRRKERLHTKFRASETKEQCLLSDLKDSQNSEDCDKLAEVREEVMKKYDKFSKARKEFKQAAREKMKSSVADEEDPALISKKFWSHLKATSKSTRIPESVHYHNRYRNVPKDKAELFNDFFKDQFSEASDYDIDIDFSNDHLNDIEFNYCKIYKLLKNINPNKAAGPDGIHGKVLKSCAGSLAYPLSLLFRLSYNTGHIPAEWKMANIVPVHKKGAKDSVENYRPISLTSLVMKIFEKVIRDELLAKCESKLNEFQHGFLPSKSCTTQMIPFADSLSISLNDRVRCDVVYFDFSKAFDSVNHDIILWKLKHQFKIDGRLLKFFVNYLQHRFQRVVINGEMSSLKPVTSGVPQGSILGPLFFVLFINDMTACVSEGTNIALYADDTKIWRNIQTWQDHLTLQNDINQLYEWSVANKMMFHPKKCKVLTVTVEQTLHCDSEWKLFPFQAFYYQLNDTELEIVKSETDLGVTVTSTLNYNEHSLKLYSKASSRLGLLRRALHFVSDQKQKRAFYLAIVRSLFEHCSVVWRPTAETTINKLENIQRRAIKWILSEEGHHYNDLEYTKRLKDLDLLPLSKKFEYTDLSVFYRIYHNLSVNKLPVYLQPLDEEDTLSRLRPVINPPTHMTGQDGIHKLSSMRANQLDKLSLKCSIKASSPAFKSSFFFRTHLLWNVLPLGIKEASTPSEFESKLKHHMWDVILDPH